MIWITSLFILWTAQTVQQPSQADSPDSTDPVVVELFTSQGCGMCPEANRLLRDMAENQEHVIAIAYGVSYWDMFGWEDQYAKPEFMARQEDYVSFGEARRVFTPHFIINGAPQMLRFNPDRIEEAVDRSEPVTLSGDLFENNAGGLTLSLSGADDPSLYPVWLVTLEGGEAVRTIEKGSNSGLDMIHYNMAINLIRLDNFDQTGQQVYEPGCPAGLNCALLVQSSQGGPIMAAALMERD